jgi:S-sulfo-L-cysteine synthase (3-phospho-L-serine-dependent)
MLYHDIVDAIGHTPLLKLRLESSHDVQVYAKLELQNIFGMKDRVAKQAILEAKRSGVLKDDAPIIESSSGTMALGVALVGTFLGHDVHIVTDPRIDPMTLAKLQSLGCTVHIVERMTSHGWQSARLERLEHLLQEYPDAFWPRQYSNPQNPLAYQALAAELADDLGHIDVLVGSVGSGGSLCGSARALRERFPNLRVIAVDCVGSVLFGQPDDPKRLQGGLGNSLVPPNLDHSMIDEVHWLNDAEAFSGTLDLAREQKIFAGNSSGSVYQVLRWLATQLQPGTQVVGLLPDRGDRYFSNIYNQEYWQAHRLSEMEQARQPRKVLRQTVVNTWSYADLWTTDPQPGPTLLSEMTALV